MKPTSFSGIPRAAPAVPELHACLGEDDFEAPLRMLLGGALIISAVLMVQRAPKPA